MRNATICLVIIALALLAGSSSAQVTFKKEKGGYTATLTEKFDVNSGGDLNMQDLEGDISISGRGSSQVEFTQEIFLDVKDEAEAKEAFENVRATVKQTGNSIDITGPGSYSSGRASGRGHSFSIRQLEKSLKIIETVRDFSASYTVHVPTSFNVDASTSGGNIDLTDLKGNARLRTAGGDLQISGVTGTADVKTSGGDVKARNLEGQVDLETSGGDVRLTDSRTGPFRLETSGGDINVQGLKGEVRASTSGGNVDARDIEGELDLRTSGGDITLSNVKAPVSRATTSGGDVEARVVIGNVDLRTSGGTVIATQVQGRVLGRTSGGNVEVSSIIGETDISTSGGDLEVTGIQGPVVGKTSGGDVRARVEKGGKLAGPIRLTTSGGEITLRLPADVQASVSARISIQDSFFGKSKDYSINSDFKSIVVDEQTEQERGRKHLTEVHASGDLNGGGPLIELETVDGDINIEKGN